MSESPNKAIHARFFFRSFTKSCSAFSRLTISSPHFVGRRAGQYSHPCCPQVAMSSDLGTILRFERSHVAQAGGFRCARSLLQLASTLVLFAQKPSLPSTSTQSAPMQYV